MDNVDKIMEFSFLDSLTLDSQINSLSAVINITFAALIGFMIIGIYILTTDKGKKDLSLIQSIPVLAILMAVMMRINGGRVAIFFGIFGILSIVRFRSELTDQKGITFILFAIIMGLLAGVGNFILTLLSFVIISAVILIIRYSFKSGRYRAAFVTISGGDGLESMKLKVDEILKEEGTDYEFCGATEKYKGTDFIREVEYLIHFKNAKLLLQGYSELKSKINGIGCRVEFKNKD